MNSFLHAVDARVTPTTAIRSKLEGLQFRELEPIDREDAPEDQYEYSQNACSQGFLGSPDFITPQDACFAIDYDLQEKENKGPRSPVVLSPQRGKRPRREVMGLALGSQDEPMGSQQSIPPMSQDDAAAPSVQRVLRSMQKPPRPSSAAGGRATRSRMALIRSQVASPPQFRNPFLLPSDPGAEPSSSDAAAAGGDAQPRPPASHSNPSAPAASPANAGAGVGRYRGDFKEISVLGQGSFCKVFKCRHRLDGCLYAVKRTKAKLVTGGDRRAALREVQTLAACGAHPNVVGYHSAWFEDDQMYIQLEHCEAALPAALAGVPPAGMEAAALAVARDIAAALAHVHSRGMAHLDVKPENILAARDPAAAASSSSADGSSASTPGASGASGASGAPGGVAGWRFKLGDFGLAAPLSGGFPACEGDCRYVAPEMLRSRSDCLDKADVWALGATLLELLSGAPLPASGPAYGALRSGKLPLLPGVRMPVQALLQRLLAEDPAQRPTAAELLLHPVLSCGEQRPRW